MEISKYISQLSALAHESRLSIFRMLVKAGPTGLLPMQISQELDMPNATLSFHLKELFIAELVTKKKQGRTIIYAANYANMSKLLQYLSENCCADDSSNCSI